MDLWDAGLCLVCVEQGQLWNVSNLPDDSKHGYSGMDESDLRELKYADRFNNPLKVLDTRFYSNFWDAYVTQTERIEVLYQEHNVTGFNHDTLFFKTPEDVTIFVLRWS